MTKKQRYNFNPSYYYEAYFNRLHPSHWFYKRKMDAIISLIPSGVTSILDCGTASGLLPYLLEIKGYQADGFDILEDFVVYGQNKLKRGRIYQDDISLFTPPPEVL